MRWATLLRGAWNRPISLFVTLKRPKMQKELSWFWVQSHVSESVTLWDRCAMPSTSSGPIYSREEQYKREQAYDEALHSVERELRRVPRSAVERLETKSRVVATFANFASIGLGLDKSAINLLTDDFLTSGAKFSRLAREFDPSLSMADIIQACRSAWTACGLQLLLGDSMEITPAILGYSLLYPYSDNYLDRADVITEAKFQFSKRFRERLLGGSPSASDHRETALWALVGLIEEQFPRSLYPQVFDCLLAIHQAQEESIAQLGNITELSDAQLLRITCAKGGTSVLADACLAHGWLSDTESRFSFEWGVLLQLGDDLQDVREDLARGSHSLFTRAVHAKIPLDALVIQLLNFSERVTAEMDCLPGASKMLKELLSTSWRSLIIGAVAESHEHFSPEFLGFIERLSPFRFDFLRARHKKLSSRQSLYSNLFEALLELGESDGSLPLNARCSIRLGANLEPAAALAVAG